MRLSWFDTLPVGLLTAISADGHRMDLLTVPPHTDESAAWAAMEQAAQTGNVANTAPGVSARPRPSRRADGNPKADGSGTTRHDIQTGLWGEEAICAIGPPRSADAPALCLSGCHRRGSRRSRSFVVAVVTRDSDDRGQVRAVDRLAFEEQVDDLVECVAVVADQRGGGGLGLS